MKSNQFKPQTKTNSMLKETSYVTHQQNFPLQLKGNSKRHSQPHSQENMKNVLNYSCAQNNDYSHKIIKNNDNCQKSQISRNNNQSLNNSLQKSSYFRCNLERNSLAQKIISNNKINQSHTKYQKSVIPGDELGSNRNKCHSLRTFNQQRKGTGINYIMQTQQKYIYKNQQKKHVAQFHAPKRQSFGKKVNSAAKQQQSRQLVQTLNENFRKQINQSGHKQSNNKENKSNHINSDSTFNNIFPSSNNYKLVHKQTTNKRISQDIHSSILKKQQMKQFKQVNDKFEQKNLFKKSMDLGYQYKQEKKVGCQKLNEMMGSQYCKSSKQPYLRQKRDDWRRTNIVIQ